jgi:CheY-like chemotaxis protein
VLVDPAPPCQQHVLGDRQRLKQVLLNLLSNAVKYNRAGGSVQLACQQVAGERLQIRVTDTGLGITPEAQQRLFVPFERLSLEQTSIEGSGLGLPLSQRLAEAMGGSLGMVSTVGQGSSFWVELPLADSPAEGAQRQQLPAWSQPSQPPPHGPTLTVLYVEDNLPNLQLVERVLSRRPGVKLITAMRPQLGLDLAEHHQLDLVLLDLQLPDMPGIEVLRRLRTNPRTTRIPVVVLSADARPNFITQVLKEGARAFLTKPLDVNELLALVDTIAAEHERAGSTSTSSFRTTIG